MQTHFRTPSLAACFGLAVITFSALHAENPATPAPSAPHQPPTAAGFGGIRGYGLENLTPEEREKLKTAAAKAMQDPKVKAARDKVEAASKEFRDAVEAAQIAADPSIEPIVAKLREAREKAMKERAARQAGEQPKP